MYCTTNFPSKKSLREAVKSGQEVTVFNPGFGVAPENGRSAVEGPHYPEAHKWYATIELVEGLVVKVS